MEKVALNFQLPTNSCCANLPPSNAMAKTATKSGLPHGKDSSACVLPPGRYVGADIATRVSANPALPGQLFYSTQIPVCLWFLEKSEHGKTFRPSNSGLALAA